MKTTSNMKFPIKLAGSTGATFLPSVLCTKM